MYVPLLVCRTVVVMRHLEIFLSESDALLALLLLSAITYLPANLTIPVLSLPPLLPYSLLLLSLLLSKTGRQAGCTSFSFDSDSDSGSTRWHHSPSFSLSVCGSFIIIIPVSHLLLLLLLLFPIVLYIENSSSSSCIACIVLLGLGTSSCLS